MPDNPFGDLIPQQQQRTPGFIPGIQKPKTPAPQTPDQAEAVRLENEAKRLAIAKAKREAAAGGDNSAQTAAIDNLVKLRKEYEGNPAVQHYKTVLPLITKAMTADPNTGAGDLSVIYSFGKVMDPGSVVREGEMAMAAGTSPLMSLAEQWRLRVEKGQRMPPAVRRQLIQEMRKAGGDMNTRFMQERARYGFTAKKYGVDPMDIIGEHPGKAFQQIEADWKGAPVRNADGRIATVPKQKKGWTPPRGVSVEPLD